MQLIPLNPIPSQTISANLNNQPCQINVYQRYSGLYCDVLVNNVLIIGGVICQNLNRIVRSVYLGFSGDLVFYDNQGSSDPFYSGLGQDASARFVLAYLTPADLANSSALFGD